MWHLKSTEHHWLFSATASPEKHIGEMDGDRDWIVEMLDVLLAQNNVAKIELVRR